MTRTLNRMISLEVIDCAVCGMMFGLTAAFIERRRQDGKSFHCPAGHSLSFKDSENDKIRRERDRLKQDEAQLWERIREEREARERAERSAAARKGQVTRMKNRAAAGVCQCCNRSFENLRRHMASQHPEFRAEEVA